MIKHWIKAFRLRTLPLAMASISLGSFLAASQGLFNLRATFLCVLTTLFLQILSNLANDYGDSIHGADHVDREGPKRLVQAGTITSEQMKKAIILFTVLSIISGLSLIYGENLLLFIPLGLLSIVAAITYTVGKKPYGYTVIDHSTKQVFKGSEILNLKYLLDESFDNDYIKKQINTDLHDYLNRDDITYYSDYVPEALHISPVMISNDVDDQQVYGMKRRRQKKARTNTR